MSKSVIPVFVGKEIYIFQVNTQALVSSSSSLLFIHGKNNQAKYTIYNILKKRTNYRINGNSIYKDEC